eukprot:TRINITY_DN50797_c0_g1_i1.p1 TRINITY_DN50797_c0_g1~~TRINITY_DN50797_c0_g1_i1.p1  ORF type:complete len:328 (+),score=82.23 TRINITY_DN50797_c0_g1_i1:101-985(+)
MAATLPGTMDNVFHAGSLPPSGPVPVMEFRAGKLTRSGTTVRPDKRKGLVQVWVEDGGLKLKWVDRRTGTVEDEHFLFQGEVAWKRVEKCTTGRVYVLDFGARQLFFWMQEPDESHDAEYARRINEYINDPAKARQDEARRNPLPPHAMGGMHPGGGGMPLEHLFEILQQQGGFFTLELGGDEQSSAPEGSRGGGGGSQQEPPSGPISSETLASVLAGLGVGAGPRPGAHCAPERAALVGNRVCAQPPGHGSRCWGTVTEVSGDGAVTVAFDGDVGERIFARSQWEAADKEFRS